MKAMILAAGYGKRLRPLTLNTPKALIRISDRTLLEILILKLKKSGFREITINTSYLGDQLISFLKKNGNFDLKINISEETEPLETGGGIKHAQKYLQNSSFFLVHNVDVISDIDLNELIDQHLMNQNFATLAVSDRKSSRYLIFNENNQLIGRKNNNTSTVENLMPDVKSMEYAFSGIYILSAGIFNFFDAENKFSILETLLKASVKEKVQPFIHSATNWYDLGKITDIEHIRKKLGKI